MISGAEGKDLRNMKKEAGKNIVMIMKEERRCGEKTYGENHKKQANDQWKQKRSKEDEKKEADRKRTVRKEGSKKTGKNERQKKDREWELRATGR